MHALLLTLTPDPRVVSEEREIIRFLGVMIDGKLTWEAHAQSVARKLARVVYFLRVLRESVSLEYLRVAYFSFFHSVMSYAVFCWGHSGHSGKVFAMQRRCIRLLGGLGYRDDCRDHFRSLEILTLPSVYILECLNYARSSADTFVTSQSVHSYNTRINEQYRQPFLRLQKSRNGSNYWSLKFYNALPAAVRCYSREKFKDVMKKFLLKNCIYSYDDFLNCNFDDI